jgi:hypothetical protein
MGAGEVVPSGQYGFAGDLFLALAKDGRLVVDPGQAELVVAELEGTLDVVRDRLGMIAIQPPVGHPPVGQRTIDALFAEQIAPGQMERALYELPKYIQAFRIAGRLP